MPIVVVRTRAVVVLVAAPAVARTFADPDGPPPQAPSTSARTPVPTIPAHALPGTPGTVDAEADRPTMREDARRAPPCRDALPWISERGDLEVAHPAHAVHAT